MAADQTARIYVIRRGWHIDVGFAAEDLAPPLARTLERLPGAHYAVFGFGDRRYLEAGQRGPGLHAPAMLAALWPGRALLLVTALAATPGAAFGDDHVIVLAASPAAVRRAQSFVWDSLQRGASQRVAGQNGDTPTTGGSADSLMPPLPGPYAGSLYFESSRRYSALHTCNTWAAELLQAAGLPMHTATILFASQLWARLQTHRRDVIADQLQGGFVPSWHTTVVPESRGTTTVVFLAGGGGLLLLMQPVIRAAVARQVIMIFTASPPDQALSRSGSLSMMKS